MSFDAKAARALSQRAHSVQDCLALLKKSVQQAAQAGEYEVTVGLALAMPVRAGESTNDAAFLVDHFARSGHPAWSESVKRATQAGYLARPSWGRDERGAVLDGITLSWRWAEPPDASVRELQLMPAEQARTMSDAEQVHQRWVLAQRASIERAAQRGLLSVSLDDATPAADPAWSKRRDILLRAGFATELIPTDRGATLVVSW